jgi:RNA polymerase sigma factor (sigma-70 family)
MNNPWSDRLLWGMRTSQGRPRARQHAPSQVTTSGHGSTPSLSEGSVVKDEALFLSSLPVIEDVTAQVCRRHRLAAAEADDFRSEVRLHFIERHYDVLRRFQGRSTLQTYLTVVIQRLFLDYRNRLWGKWRPSMEAKRLGPTAILLERLVSRDGWSFEQAAEMLRVNHGVVVDETLSALYVKVSQRLPYRQLAPESEATEIKSSSPAPDTNVLRAEQDFLAKRVHTALDRARQALAPEERLILRMRFEDAVPVADIARALHLNQKRLYRTIERLLADLRKRLEADGVSGDEVKVLFAEGSLSTEDGEGAQQIGAVSITAVKPAERTRTPWLQKR